MARSMRFISHHSSTRSLCLCSAGRLISLQGFESVQPQSTLAVLKTEERREISRRTELEVILIESLERWLCR